MNKAQLKKLNDIFVTSPHLSDREIARKTKLTHGTIGKYRKQFWELIDKEFIAHSVKKSIHEMRRSVEQWHKLKEQAQKILDDNKKTVTVVVMENKKKKIIGTTVELSPDEKRGLIHEISDLEAKIQEYGNDPEASQILKIMHNAIQET